MLHSDGEMRSKIKTTNIELNQQNTPANKVYKSL